MRLVCLSDTHNRHHDIALPDGDILIHAGDCTDGGTRYETQNFLEWFSNQSHEYKILVPGNHDFYFEKHLHLINIPDNIILLIDEGIEIEKFKFWGSPVTPGIQNWAFNRERGTEIKKHWDLIPENTDVLITHTPPYGILDETQHGIKLGCRELSEILQIVEPKYHLFGHIHHSAGASKRSSIHYFNLSNLDERLRIMHPATIIDL